MDSKYHNFLKVKRDPTYYLNIIKNSNSTY